MGKRLIWSTGALGLLMVLIGALVVIFDPGPTRPFDSAGWQAAAGDASSTVRLEMVDDLLEGGVLGGRSIEQVIEILGPAETDNYFRGSGFDVMYRLGSGRGILPGPTYLALAFDERSGVLVEAVTLKD